MPAERRLGPARVHAFARSLGAGVVLAALLASRVAAEPDDADRKKAREAYGRAESFFAQGVYDGARDAFQEAYDTIPNPIVLQSIAECEVRLGRLEEGLAALERYLAERPDAADRAAVEQKIADLKATPSTLVITSTPPGAAIRLDGTDLGQVTPTELQVARGEHAIEVSAEGYDAASTTVAVRLGARHEIDLALHALPPPPPPPAPVEGPAQAPPPEPVDEPPTTALWISGVVGGVGIVTGTVLGIAALNEKAEFDETPTEATADRGERLALFADVAFGIGAMALLTGAVLFLTYEPAAAEDEQASDGLVVAPVVDTERAGVTARLRF